MQLKKFYASNAGARTGTPTISFGKAGCISISKTGCEQMELKAGEPVSLFHDESEVGDWYIGKDKEGFLTRDNKGGGGFPSTPL